MGDTTQGYNLSRVHRISQAEMFPDDDEAVVLEEDDEFFELHEKQYEKMYQKKLAKLGLSPPSDAGNNNITFFAEKSASDTGVGSAT